MFILGPFDVTIDGKPQGQLVCAVVTEKEDGALSVMLEGTTTGGGMGEMVLLFKNGRKPLVFYNVVMPPADPDGASRGTALKIKADAK